MKNTRINTEYSLILTALDLYKKDFPLMSDAVESVSEVIRSESEMVIFDEFQSELVLQAISYALGRLKHFSSKHEDEYKEKGLDIFHQKLLMYAKKLVNTLSPIQS